MQFTELHKDTPGLTFFLPKLIKYESALGVSVPEPGNETTDCAYDPTLNPFLNILISLLLKDIAI
jgi:hypothetical protein